MAGCWWTIWRQLSRTTRGAIRQLAGLRPMTPSRVAKLTGTETRADRRKEFASITLFDGRRSPATKSGTPSREHVDS